MSKVYRGPAIDASYHVSVHLAKRFQRRLKKISLSETRMAYGAMFVNGSELNGYLYRGPSKDASYQVSIHLVKQF